nr:EscU/YscU/HrcU family type III secretion system export apparatus switch protein [Mesorhizobium sp.]
MRQSPHSTKNHNLIVAVTFVTEVGDASRFESPRQLWDISVWFPASAQPGETVRRGGITKAGNGRVRHMLVESAWTYRHPPKVGKAKLYRLEQASPKVCEIAWKAQSRLTARYRMLSARGKRTTVVCTAIARELVGFMWAVARKARGSDGHSPAVVPPPPMRVAPNFTRLDPIKGLKRFFEIKALSELLKSLIKVAIVGGSGVLIGMFLFNTAIWAPLCGDACVLRTGLHLFGAITPDRMRDADPGRFRGSRHQPCSVPPRPAHDADRIQARTEGGVRQSGAEEGPQELRARSRRHAAAGSVERGGADLLAGFRHPARRLYYGAGMTSVPVVLALLEGAARTQRVRAGFCVPIMTQSPLADEVFDAAVPGRYIQLRFFERVVQAMAA